METIALVVYWVCNDPSPTTAGCNAVVMWAGHPMLNELVLSFLA